MKPLAAARGKLPFPRYSVVAALALILHFLAASLPAATTDTWTSAGSGNWSTAANWTNTSSGHTVPAAGDTVNIVNTNNISRAVTYDYLGPAITLATLTIDLAPYTGTNTNTLSIANNASLALTTSGAEILGLNGSGALTQAGGSNTITGSGYLDIAAFAGSTGSYTLSGGSFTCSAGEFIGDRGLGFFNQSGGTHTTSGGNAIVLGSLSGGNGTYNLSLTGSLIANGPEYVGYAGLGTFNQSGGSNTMTGANALILGNSVGSAGSTYALSGGTLTGTAVSWIGNAANSSFNQTGGTANFADIQVARTAGVAASISLNDPTGLATFNANNVYLGGTDTAAAGGGTLTVTNGTMNINILKVWNTAGSIINLNGGTLAVKALDLNGNLNHLNWTAGTLAFTSNVTGPNIENSGPLGNSVSISGSQTLKTTAYELVGGSTAGSVNQTGGTNTIGTYLDLADSAGAAGSSYTLSGGTFTAPGTVANASFLGALGNASFTQSGGNATFGDIQVARTAGVTASISLNDPTYLATFTASQVYLGGSNTVSGGAGTLNITRGTMTIAHLAIWNLGQVNLNGGTLNVAILGFAPGGGPGSPSQFNWTGGTLNLTGSNDSGGYAIIDTTANFSALGSALNLDLNRTFSAAGGVFVGDGGTGTINQSANTCSIANFLQVGEQGTGVYTLSGGTLSVATTVPIGTAFNSEIIGNFGNGSFIQTGGTHILGSNITDTYFAIAVYPGSIGSYALSAGTFSIYGNAFVGGYFGAGGAGTLSITGGSMSVSGGLTVFNSPGTILNLNGGSLSANSLNTDSNPARFNWTAGTLGITGAAGFTIGPSGPLGPNLGLNSTQTLNVTNTLSIASGGLLSLSGGSLTVGSLDTGNTPARFNWTGGTLTLTGSSLSIDTGTALGNVLTIGPGQILKITNGGMNLGTVTGGTLTQSGGNASFTTSPITPALVLGNSTTGVGTYNLTGGSLTSTGTVYVSNGTINQSGGSASISSDPSYFALDLGIFGGASGTATYVLGSGATLNVNGPEAIGAGLTSGTFVQNGGTHAVTSSSIFIGVQGANGSYQLNGGFLSAGGIVIGDTFLSATGSGTFTQTGGSATIAGAITVGNVRPGVLNIMAGSMTAGSMTVNNVVGSAVNLSAGTFTLGGMNISANPALFNWTGGSLTQASGTFNVTAFTVPAAGTYNFNGGTFTGQLVNNGITNLNSNFTASNGMTNNGTVNPIVAAVTATFSGVGLANNGAITIAGGTIAGTAVVNNELLTGNGSIATTGGLINNGTINQSGGNLTTTLQGMTNNGTINLAAGLKLAMGGNMDNHGTVNLNGASITGSSQVNNFSDGVIIGPGIISESFLQQGTLWVPNGTTKAGTFTNSGVVEMAGSAAILGPGGVVTNSATFEGVGKIADNVTNNGTIQPINGTLVFSGTLANTASGLILTTTGNKVLVTTGLATNAGILSLTGGTFDNGGQALNNTGQITGYGILNTGGTGLTNNNILTLTGGTSTINGPVTNSAGKTLNVKFQPAIFTGPIINNGTIKVTSTTVTFTNSYTGNNYTSDPATNIFQNNVTIIPGGLMSGGVGDVFNLSGGIFANNGAFSNGGTLASADNATNAGTFTQSGPQTWSNGATFTNAAGTATFASNAGSSSSSPLSITLNNGAINFAAAQNINALSINNGQALLTAGATKTNALSFLGTTNNWTGQLDLTGNALIVEATAGKSSVISTLANQIASGKNGGTWTGTGITSSAVASNPNTTLALIDNAELGATTFRGQSGLDSNSLIITQALLGDVNLDNTISFADLLKIAQNFGQPGGWAAGNMNGPDNGGTSLTVDFADLLSVAQHFGQTLPLLPDSDPNSNLAPQSSSLPAAPVPEPSTLLLLSLGTLALLPRRRQTSP